MADNTTACNATPLVSVVIPAFNAARTLRMAVDSVLSQTYPALEIIVIDDASTDDTPNVIAEYCQPNFRSIRLRRNSGVSAARNRGIEAAQGELIAFLDADDEWLPEKISRQMAEYACRPAISMVACYAYDISASGEILHRHNAHRKAVTGPHAWRTLLRYPFIMTSAVMIPKALLDQAGGFDTAMRVAEDQDLWIRLARLGEVGFVHEPLVLKRYVPESLSIGGPAQDHLTYYLPMVMRHVAAAEKELGRAEKREILRERYMQIGQNCYSKGLRRQGLKLLAKAIMQGEPAFRCFRFLVANTPLAAALTRLRKR